MGSLISSIGAANFLAVSIFSGVGSIIVRHTTSMRRAFLLSATEFSNDHARFEEEMEGPDGRTRMRHHIHPKT